jgi:GntR family transcriptional regulator
VGRAAVAVRGELAQAIANGYRPGDRLPAEPELAAAYRVSRATMREALQRLEGEGVVRRVHGVGTFVNRMTTKVISALDVDLGVTEAVRAAHQRLGVQVRRSEEVAAPHDIGQRLDLPPIARVLWIERTILANDVPAVAAVDAIPASIAAQARRSYEGGSVYHFLEADCGVGLVGGSASVTAVGADRRLATVLRVEEDEPLLRIVQVERDADDVAVLYSEEHYVPRLFELTIRRARRGRSVA